MAKRKECDECGAPSPFPVCDTCLDRRDYNPNDHGTTADMMFMGSGFEENDGGDDVTFLIFSR
jgi:hypothetical protein